MYYSVDVLTVFNCVENRSDLINPGNQGLFGVLRDANKVISEGQYELCNSIMFMRKIWREMVCNFCTLL